MAVMKAAIGFILVACVTGLRRRRSSVDCDSLSSLVVYDGTGNVSVGEALVVVCNRWPADRGVFPINNLETATELLTPAFAGEGLWWQMQELLLQETLRTGFCWRHYVNRPSADVTTCFEDGVKYAGDMRGGERSVEPSAIFCQKRCSLVEGCEHFSFWEDGGCHLQNAGAWGWWRPWVIAGPPSCSSASLMQLNASASDERFVHLNTHRTKVAQLKAIAADESLVHLNMNVLANGSDASGCDAVYNGQCYEACPEGYTPSLLKGWFAPVCMSECSSDPSHPVSCSFGCATSLTECAKFIYEEGSAIVDTLSTVVAYATGSFLVSSTVSKLFSLIYFIRDVLWPIFQIVKETFSIWDDGMRIAGFLTIFLALAQQKAEYLGSNVPALIAVFGNIITFWIDLVAEGLSYLTAPIDALASLFSALGDITGDASEDVDAAWGFASQYVYGTCDISS